ncbi:cobalamin B12-binding domain-containing protein [Candidatus Accumulibacter sp. ACC007]|uniref:cobalamin B12-binding domain-containing protein n=1 Tax=Candidatus Accumulibacter sp. ACC007 TaxID=2823333 RepID=UPI0025C5CEA0|nr:cobalamin B12-binding domain-containing protein [Candidatus Accumulibacter sp. ACC007]
MTTTSFYQTDEETIERFLALRGEAIAHATAASQAAWPELFARRGPQALAACAEDIAYHLDFLHPSLASGDLSPFLAYLGWLAQVLSSRGVPCDSLPRSLDDLGEFFAKRLGAAARPVLAALTAGREALAGGLPPPSYDRPCPVPWEEAEAFGNAMLAGQRREASALFNQALDREGSLAGAEVHVVQPALYEVGRRWQQNGVSVAQEHLATAMAQSLMAQGFGRAEAAADNGRKALLACPAGNHHSVGLRMVADAFELAGWTVHYLGADVPQAALIDQVKQLRPDLIGLSASLPQQLRSLRETLAVLRASLADRRPRIVVGGLVFNQFPLLAQSFAAELLGADAVSAAAAASASLNC